MRLWGHTVERYIKDIVVWFDRGCKKKGSKMSAAKMREALLANYPRNYDISNEYYVTSAISRFDSTERGRTGTAVGFLPEWKWHNVR